MSIGLDSTDDIIQKFMMQARLDAELPDPPPSFRPREDLPPYEPGANPKPTDEKVLEIVTNAVSSPAGKSALKKAIDDLGDSAFSIEVCFTNVARGLAQAAAVSSGPQREKILEFHGEWDMHRRTYIDLLWSSRVVAGHARTTAKDFAKDFVGLLKDDSISLEDKKEEIHGYREQLAEDIKNSQNLSQGFLDLQTNVAEFQEKIFNWLQTTHNQVQVQIEELLREIESTEQKIKELTRQMFFGAAVSLGLGAVAAGALAIGIICPLLWIGAAGAAFFAAKRGADVMKQLQIQKGERENLKAREKELEKLQEELAGIQRAYTIIDPLKSDMVLIREKLGVFAQIWAFIRADLVEIEKSMQMATTVKTKHLFKKRLDTIAEIYSALCDALYQYETRVHTQPMFKPYQ